LKEADTMGSRAERLAGTVKSLKIKEGYGFISHATTGEDHFFHRSALRGGLKWDDMIQNMSVTFVASDGPKGLRAIDVEEA
jgi:cold shock CspA family protein